jgi:hypothetical protein
MQLRWILTLLIAATAPAAAFDCPAGIQIGCPSIPCTADSTELCECPDGESACDYHFESCLNDGVGGCQPIHTVTLGVVYVQYGPFTSTIMESTYTVVTVTTTKIHTVQAKVSPSVT